MKAAWFFGLATTAEPAAYDLPWWRVGALLGLLVALFGIWWYLNRGKMNLRQMLQPTARRMVVHEQRWINSRTVICFVEVEGRRFLLAQTTGSVAWQSLDAVASGVPTESLSL